MLYTFSESSSATLFSYMEVDVEEDEEVEDEDDDEEEGVMREYKGVGVEGDVYSLRAFWNRWGRSP